MWRWTCASAALALVASLVYEWMWDGGDGKAYLGVGILGLTLILMVLVRVAAKRVKKEPRAMEWFLLAALMCALFFAALEKAPSMDPPRVVCLPFYPILFLDFFLSGCYTWWKKHSGER